MIRRSFFQTLAAALLPQPVITVAETPPLPFGQTARNFRIDRMEMVETAA